MNPADRPTLLIVDDLPANLGVLVDFLGGAGYRVLVATSGEWALEQLAHVQPDLILLDLAMPGWDGYETCRRLKADDRWREIPVLILTALSDVVDKVRGFEAGAVDFITKPLEPAEVLARVRTHLQIRALQKTLEERNALLRETSALLQQSLDRAVVLARPDGEVAFCTRRARDLLDQHFPGQGSAARLPDAVVGWHARQPAAPWRLAGTVAGAGLEILLEGTAAPDPPPSAAVLQRLGLTAREAEALYWITYGKTTAEIAEILGTSPGTVKKQVQAMLEKLGVETRLAAALRAMEVLGLPVSG
jgi:DNA-binding response OmpR family regulator/DNA-binding CsgD family transcriptional regulator